jgi:hypothetical protein
MKSMKLATMHKLVIILTLVWVVGFFACGLSGVFGDPHKSMNPLLFLLFIVVTGIGIMFEMALRGK